MTQTWSEVFVLSKRTVIVIGVVIVVAVLYVIQSGKKGNAQTTTGSVASGTCQVQVTADVLNVRSGPEGTDKVVGKLTNGAVHTATATVKNGYRELAANQWASGQFLKPVSGSC